jgi:hypothetical protein
MTGRPFVPPNLVAGRLPHASGFEHEMVWHAATEACGTGNLHWAWRIGPVEEEGRRYLYYLAAPSSDFASRPDTVCPLASCLPDADQDLSSEEAVYTYDDGDFVHGLVHSHAQTRFAVLRAASGRAERVLEGTGLPIEPIDDRLADLQDRLVAWTVGNQGEERFVRQAVARLLAGARLLTVAFALAALGLLAMSVIVAQRIPAQAARNAADETALLEQARQLSHSPAMAAIGRLLTLNDDLHEIGGTLVEFRQQADGRVTWRAEVPASVTAEVVSSIGGRTQEVRDGRVVVVNR